MDDADKKIEELTTALQQSMQGLKRAYNEYQEGEEQEAENPEAILNEL